MKRNLVIVRAGRNSTHAMWLTGGDPNFDLLIANYEPLPDTLRIRGLRSIYIPGTKVAGWARLFAENMGLLTHYTQIALIDDDIICSATDINRTFDVGAQYCLSLWQPSLTWDSYFSYAVFLHNPLFSIRFTNFIEMMSPFFSAEYLRKAVPLFSLGYETAIDRFWCRLRDDPFQAFAVVDSVKVRHTRRTGSNARSQGFTRVDNAYQDEINRIEAKTGIFFRGPVVYAGITKNGRRLSGRLKMAVCAVILILSWRRSVNSGWFFRPVTDQVRHILLRPIGNEPIDIDRLVETSSS